MRRYLALLPILLLALLTVAAYRPPQGIVGNIGQSKPGTRAGVVATAAEPSGPWPDGKLVAVAFTFDDGSAAWLRFQTILDSLGVAGTFQPEVNTFVNDELDTGMLTTIMAAGHEVANQGWYTKQTYGEEGYCDTIANCLADADTISMTLSRSADSLLVWAPEWEVGGFSYPYGADSAALRDSLVARGYIYGRDAYSEAGYEAAPTLRLGWPQGYPYQIPAYPGATDLWTSGTEAAVRDTMYARMDRHAYGLVTFYFHSYADCHYEQLAYAIRAALHYGAWVAPLDTIVAYWRARHGAIGSDNGAWRATTPDDYAATVGWDTYGITERLEVWASASCGTRTKVQVGISLDHGDPTFAADTSGITASDWGTAALCGKVNSAPMTDLEASCDSVEVYGRVWWDEGCGICGPDTVLLGVLYPGVTETGQTGCACCEESDGTGAILYLSDLETNMTIHAAVDSGWVTTDTTSYARVILDAAGESWAQYSVAKDASTTVPYLAGRSTIRSYPDGTLPATNQRISWLWWDLSKLKAMSDSAGGYTVTAAWLIVRPYNADITWTTGWAAAVFDTLAGDVAALSAAGTPATTRNVCWDYIDGVETAWPVDLDLRNDWADYGVMGVQSQPVWLGGATDAERSAVRFDVTDQVQGYLDGTYTNNAGWVIAVNRASAELSICTDGAGYTPMLLIEVEEP